MENEKVILVWRSAALGDFILSCPALYELRRNFPDHKILLLTISSGEKKQRIKVEKIYNSNGNILPWIELAKPHLLDDYIALRDVSISDFFNLKKTISKYNIDFSVLMLDPCAPYLGRLKKLLMMKFLSPFSKIYGWRSYGSLASKNKTKLKEKGLLKHHVHGPLQFLNEIRTKFPYPTDSEIKFNLSPSDEEDQWAKKYLSENGILDGRYLILGPGAIHEHKMWPLENYKNLSKILCQEFSVKILILGTSQDSVKAEVIKAVSPNNIFNLAGITSIGQSAALMKRAKIFIGNDGGAAHLSDAMNCKTISIIPGIEYPDSIEPWNSRDISIRKSVSCAPCYNFTSCKNEDKFICMSGVLVTDVLEAFKKVGS